MGRGREKSVIEIMEYFGSCVNFLFVFFFRFEKEIKWIMLPKNHWDENFASFNVFFTQHFRWLCFERLRRFSQLFSITDIQLQGLKVLWQTSLIHVIVARMLRAKVKENWRIKEVHLNVFYLLPPLRQNLFLYKLWKLQIHVGGKNHVCFCNEVRHMLSEKGIKSA